MVVLNQNLFKIPTYEISDSFVIMTIFDAETVYAKSQLLIIRVIFYRRHSR